MKKIININFQGRVIPIEETAYDILKQYVESLRIYFAKEEGRDEIINDIEGRIAELFSERLKTVACITDDDVNNVIAGIGRPEDLQEAEAAASADYGNATTGAAGSTYRQQTRTHEPRRLFRSETDKILGGVCGGIAYYLKIDPAIVRILFLLITIGGFGAGFLIYIVLWIVLPSQPLVANVRKRLFRNPDDRIIGGVASGLASYFNMAVWIPRLIFAAPFILGIITSIFHFWHGGRFYITGGFGGTLIITYIILWIILPEAVSASEKLEMRGEKIDLGSIKNTVQEDLNSLKNRTEKWGAEVKERAMEYSTSFKKSAGAFASEVPPVSRSAGRNLANAIVVLFKIFFLFIAGIIAFALITALMAIVFGTAANGTNILAISDFIFDAPWHGYLAWGSIILLLGIPAIAILTFLIRRIIGARSKRPYLGYVFGSLWILGIAGAITLMAIIARNFNARDNIEEDIPVVQPSNGKLYVRLKDMGNTGYNYRYNWKFNNNGFFLLGDNNDSLLLRNVNIEIVKSSDSSYHVHKLTYANAKTRSQARELASRVDFSCSQNDSLLLLPKGFTITNKDKFRNQQVLLVIEVPEGKKIEVDRHLNSYLEFSIDFNEDWDDRWNSGYDWRRGEEYMMTHDGLEKTRKPEKKKENNKAREIREKLKIKFRRDSAIITTETI